MKDKSFNKKRAAIILAVVLALVIAGMIVYSFFSPKSVAGEWEMVVNPEIAKSTPDEPGSSEKVYYVFGSPGQYGDGTYKTLYGGGVEEGKYKLSEKDGKQLILIPDRK